MHFPAKRILLLLTGLAAASSAYVGKWHSFTSKNVTTSLIVHQGFVYAGTQGGIRRINPSTLQEQDYGNLDGLLDCWIVGLAEGGDGNLWAVSHSGYVYSLSGGQWNAYGRSYAAEQWMMSDRAVVAAGRYLFLGSVMGLTVFDLNQKVSQANITRFADLTGDSVLSVLRRADTLYVGTPHGVYKARIDFSNPINPDSTYGNLSDPRIWAKAPLSDSISPGVARQYNFLTFISDSLATFGPGTLLQDSVRVQAFAGQAAIIGSKAFDSVNASSALFENGRVFMGGSGGLFLSTNPRDANPGLSSIPTLSKFPADTVWNVAADQNDLWGQSMSGIYHINPASGDALSFSGLFKDASGNAIPTEEIFSRHLRNLRVAGDGDVYVGSWGLGLLRFRNGQQRAWTGTTDPCIIDVVQNYPVVYSVSNIGKQGLFFTMFEQELGGSSQLVYLDTATEHISCLDSSVSGGYPHAVHIFSDSLVGVGSESGVTFYKVRQGANGPVLSSLGLWTTAGQANETWSLTTDNLGRPWALIGDQLAYVENDTLDASAARPGSVSKTLQVAEGFTGTGCFALENDPLGTLWAGCGNGLFHIYAGASGIGKIEHFGLDDGLLSPSISDISVDPSNGQIWIATDRGVSTLESASQPPVATLQSARVYPNPFRPQHRFVIFDNLPQDATVRIHNAAGAVVRIFHPRDLVGNQAQWDGTNEDGRPVAAGVYLYSITAGSSVERGKLIVAR